MPLNSEKLIRREAELAINQILGARLGHQARKLKPEIRKAFPFGPMASQREKEIWEDAVSQAVSHMEKWPLPFRQEQ